MLSLVFVIASVYGQSDLKVIQFSGKVVAMEDDKIEKLMFTNIAVKGTSRGTSADIDGFFSLPVREGEVVQFSRIGFELYEFTIPEMGENMVMYSKDIIMKKDNKFLPETYIYPWPDKDFFKIEFLALEVDRTFQDIADANISPETMEMLKYLLPVDGGEVTKMELRQVAQQYYYAGQMRPQNIFNPLSWKKFIDAIKRGDFKKKER